MLVTYSGCYYAAGPINDSGLLVPYGVVLNGTDADDTVGQVNGTFNGGGGDDTVYSVYGTFNGGGGDDTVSTEVGGTFNGGPGNDSVSGSVYNGIAWSADQDDKACPQP